MRCRQKRLAPSGSRRCSRSPMSVATSTWRFSCPSQKISIVEFFKIHYTHLLAQNIVPNCRQTASHRPDCSRENGNLSTDQKAELGHYLMLEHLLRLAKARAYDYISAF